MRLLRAKDGARHRLDRGLGFRDAALAPLRLGCGLRFRETAFASPTPPQGGSDS